MSIKIECPICHSKGTASFSERVSGGALAWSASYQCSLCDYAEEVDGVGQLPDAMRRIVLEREGEWRLILESLGEHPAQGLKHSKMYLN